MRIYLNGELYHHGVKGQQWGKRRYQNPDGTLTAEGRAHLGIVNAASRTNMLGAQRQARLLGNALPTQQRIEDRQSKDLAVSPEWKEVEESQKTYTGFGRVVSDRLLSAEMTNDAKKLSVAVIEGKDKAEEIISDNTTVEEATKKEKTKKTKSSKASTKKKKEKKKKKKPSVHGSVNTKDLEITDTGATNQNVVDFLRRGRR